MRLFKDLSLWAAILGLIIWLALIILSLGCEPVTVKAALRHEAYSKLGSCLSYKNTQDCLKENAQWCREHGLDSACGADLFWGRHENH